METIDSTSALSPSSEELSPLEQDVLEEYERLAENMKKVIPLSLPRVQLGLGTSS